MNTENTLHVLFERRVAHNPDALALVYEGHTLTYAELNKKANQLAWYLRQKGVKAETPVAICMERSPLVLISILGILKAGGAYVPLDSSNPKNRLDLILDDNQSPLLIITSTIQTQFSHYKKNLIILDKVTNQLNKQATDNPNSISTGQNLAYIIYTSGSTGIPKGVMLEHQSVINHSQWFANFSQCHPSQRIDFSGNYCFDMNVTNTIVAMILGLTIVICREEVKRNISMYLKFLQENKINIIKITPSYFKLLVHEIKNKVVDLPDLTTIILGGENLLTIDCASWIAQYPEHHLYNEYGPTEATIAVTHHPVNQDNISSLGSNVPIGKPAPGVVCFILDGNQSPVKDGEPGEMYIGGNFLARGYLNKPELTRKCFFQLNNETKNRVYKTGDICRKLPDGNIEFISRIDSQIKIRGFRVELGEVEKHLTNLPWINSAIVQAKKNHLGEQRLIAYYILKNKKKHINIQKIRKTLQSIIPQYMIPSVFVSMDAFPLTANNKLDIKRLPSPNYITSVHFTEPKTSLERRIAEIWSERLEVKPIGLDDNFFELGGHSLSAAWIISTINHKYEISLSLSDLYSYPTIRKLARNIKAKIKSQEQLPPDRIVEKTDKPYFALSDFQLMLWVSNTFEPKAKKINISARKRIKGHLNLTALNAAFVDLFKQHQLLLSHESTFRPVQWVENQYKFKLSEQNIEHLSKEEQEIILRKSMQELINHYPWSKKEPALKARVFILSTNVTEIQLSLPHIISDNFSPDILFDTLSEYYLFHKGAISLPSTPIDTHYNDYIAREQAMFQQHLDNDIQFWQNYLKEVGAFSFPIEQVVPDMQAKDLPYSSYLKIPEQAISALQEFCAINHISIQDSLNAVIALALYRLGDKNSNENQNILLNHIKTTRNNLDYEHALGCFLRLEPVKVNVKDDDTVASLSAQIHQEVIKTSPYQQCSSLVKLAYIQMFKENQSRIKHFLVSFFINLYSGIALLPKSSRKILSHCARLAHFERNNHFLVNINMHHHFIDNDAHNKKPGLFGLKSIPVSSAEADLISIDYLLEICFLRQNNKPYIVISANLKPEFRKLLGKEIIKLIKISMLPIDKNII